MQEVTLLLKDEELCLSLQVAAEKYGCSTQEIVKDAVKQWLIDMEMDELEMDEIKAASRDWWENGGVEANRFFESLNREEK